jgi:hypothetical protein
MLFYVGKSKKKQKNRTDIGLPIPVFVSRISQEDDTSSTTTESSTGDGDEKVILFFGKNGCFTSFFMLF